MQLLQFSRFCGKTWIFNTSYIAAHDVNVSSTEVDSGVWENPLG